MAARSLLYPCFQTVSRLNGYSARLFVYAIHVNLSLLGGKMCVIDYTL